MVQIVKFHMRRAHISYYLSLFIHWLEYWIKMWKWKTWRKKDRGWKRQKDSGRVLERHERRESGWEKIQSERVNSEEGREAWMNEWMKKEKEEMIRQGEWMRKNMTERRRERKKERLRKTGTVRHCIELSTGMLFYCFLPGGCCYESHNLIRMTMSPSAGSLMKLPPIAWAHTPPFIFPAWHCG